MALNNGVLTIFPLFCVLLMVIIIASIDANVIKRREIAATLQQNGENQTKTTTIATLRLNPVQNESESAVAVKSTRLLPVATSIERVFPTAADDQFPQMSKRTGLHLARGSSDELETEEKHPPSRSEPMDLPASTTPALLNAIDAQQEPKNKRKSLSFVVDELESAPTTLVPVVTTTSTLPPPTTTLPPLFEGSSTNDSLSHDKPKLSLEENASNDLQFSNHPKQPKFLNDNSTNSNRLNLPNTADVWTLAGMKTVSPRSNDSHSDELPPKQSTDDNIQQQHPVKEKTLTDWTQIVQMGADKSDGNSITEDHRPHSSFDDGELMTTTTTTTTPIPPIQKSVNITKSNLNLEPNESTTPTPPANANATAFLSTDDNVQRAVISSNETQNLDEEQAHHTQRAESDEEKIIRNEEKTEVSSSQPKSGGESAATTAALPTMEMMTTISTPATASVSTTTTEKSTWEKRVDEFESEKGNKEGAQGGGVDEFGTTLTTTNRSPLKLATIDEEIATTTTSSPDTRQIGTTKSNLEADIKGDDGDEGKEEVDERATIEATSTPTPSLNAQSSNSSAFANPTLTQEKDQKEEENKEEEEEDVSDKDLVNVVTTTTDSLLNTQTTSIFTSPPPPPRETSISTAEVVEAETTVTPLETKATETTTPETVEATTVAKDTKLPVTTSTPTTEPPSPSTFDFNERTEAENVITTLQPLDIPTANTEQREESATSIVEEIVDSTTTEAPSRAEMSNATISAVNESTNSEATLTNFIDDSTTTSTSSTTSTTTTTSAPPPNSTISPATIELGTTILSVETTEHTEDIETTPIITEETPTEIATTDLLNAETPSSTIASNKNVGSTTTTTTSTSTTTTTTTELPTEITETTNEMFPVAAVPSPPSSLPSLPETTTLKPITFPAGGIGMGGGGILQAQPPKSTADSPETDVNVVIAISVSVIGVVALVLLVAFLYLMRKRQKATSYGQRCRPVSLDAYSLDNISVLGSVRRKVALRASKRTYGNAAFDDPSLRHNVLQSAAELAKFVERRSSIFEEFRDIPQITARPEEIPEGCENKNRYANVIPLPETRVILQRRNDDDTSEYINANYVRGPKDAPNYYIACQAPLESTVQDFWRMIWEQQSRVIIQATDLIENGVEKCAEYLPPSVTLDNHTTFGDFQVLLKNREIKDKYAISTLMLKNTITNTSREITHYWYKWPEVGVPSEEAPIIAMLLEARSSLKSYALEVTNELKEKSNSNAGAGADGEKSEEKTLTTSVNGAGSSSREINGNVTEKTKTISRNQGPLTIHCSPGTGRTGTIIACDIAIRSLESTKSLDIPQILYYIRRGRASSVQTKEQYEFIYKIANVYAMKITNVPSDN